MNGMSNAINLTAIIISTLALITSLAAIVLVLAQRWSTHKIEWKPLVTHSTEEAPLLPNDDGLSDEEFLEKALTMNKKTKKEKPEVDPLAEITNSNF